jgi:hypothetical protein
MRKATKLVPVGLSYRLESAVSRSIQLKIFFAEYAKHTNKKELRNSVLTTLSNWNDAEFNSVRNSLPTYE